MTEESELFWKELTEIAKANHRPHAGHFSWETNRSIEEMGVVQEFEDALAKAGQPFFSQTRHRGTGNDPPDCEARLHASGLVGIEVTELVDPASAAAARAGLPYDWKDWRPDLVPTLESVIRNKDAPAALKGGPYEEYVLVVHTDEPWLELGHTRWTLANHAFPTTSLITKAYLLVSFDPFEQGYPCIQLKIDGN